MDWLVESVQSRGRGVPGDLSTHRSRAQKYLAQASSATLSAVITAMKDVLPAKALPKLLAASGEVLASRFGTDRPAKAPGIARSKRSARFELDRWSRAD